MPKISTGDMVPDFSLPTHGGDICSLAGLAGTPFVLFFYPKDDTPGCTKEAIGFTEALPEFEKLGVAIFGVSPDPLKKHDKFRDKHGLKVPLLSDEDKTMLEACGVWVEKSMYGKKYMGVERTTFLVGRDGKIVEAWHKVKVPGHVEAVLEAARTLAD